VEKLSQKLMNWASILEPETRAQAELTAALPFVFPHVALMPDAHLGKGATVGSVIPTQGAIVPAAVGVDIGCGMIARRTAHTVAELPQDLAGLRQAIEAAIPLSPGNYNTALTATAGARIAALESAWPSGRAGEQGPDRIAANWREQLGSLGGGNHFIEVSADEQDRVWFFLHSGSRGVGNRIAQRHIKVAAGLMAKWFIDLPDPDLAYLVEGTDEFWDYIKELTRAQEFAAASRAEMIDRVAAAFTEWSGLSADPVESVQCHHNYTARERHWGKQLWISRKGAIDAHEGVAGLIPGSMGTASYVVEGLGNRPSLCSAPHGAGRAMSRTRARAEFTLDDLRAAMAGIEFRDDAAFVDEIPSAYKDIDQVMADAADLVRVRHTLRQIVNVKGE
jgi:tRNA-splicing ligase RtcB